MTTLANKLLRKYYRSEAHPYRHFERKVDQLLRPQHVLLDAGCGRTAPILSQYRGRAAHLIGVDLVDFVGAPDDIELHNSDLAHLPLADASVDLIMSRSVFEHLMDPEAVYKEFNRVLRPGGAVVFLTANMWDYGTLVARMVPNRMHSKIVKKVEGREEEDTFPTAYRTNTRKAVDRLAAAENFRVESFEYLSQYPNYLMFNGGLFFLGMCFEKLISRFEMLKYLRGWILVSLRKPA